MWKFNKGVKRLNKITKQDKLFVLDGLESETSLCVHVVVALFPHMNAVRIVRIWNVWWIEYDEQQALSEINEQHTNVQSRRKKIEQISRDKEKKKHNQPASQRKRHQAK